MATAPETTRKSVLNFQLNAGIVERILSFLILVGVLAAIVFGWAMRHRGLPDPEYGLGYALGIIGGSMMVLLLAYPLRKRARGRTKAAGSIGFWFRFHMLLGLLGPLAILYHSRFTFGSLNSAVALGAMIIVAGSGLAGRFLYSRVHRGYSNRKLELRALKDDMDALIEALEQRGAAGETVRARLQDFEDCAIAAGGAFWSSASAVLGLGVRTRIAEARTMRSIREVPGADRAELKHAVGAFFQAARRAAEFAFYDRLLRLWHLLHLPLFILLVAAAILHIVAVHMY